MNVLLFPLPLSTQIDDAAELRPGSVEHASLVVRTLLGLAPAAGNVAAAARVSAEQVARRAALSETEAALANNADHLTMVFLNTADTAKQFAENLRFAGVHCVEFHKLCRATDREASLRQFRTGEVKIFVCTDSAARGLDLPQVRLVIQAEFALNVVQHQHRVGRASRGGRIGRAANLVFPESRSLVENLLMHQTLLVGCESEIRADTSGGVVGHSGDSVPEGRVPVGSALQPDNACSTAGIEHAFSRRRGFRRSIKRQRARLHIEDVPVL